MELWRGPWALSCLTLSAAGRTCCGVLRVPLSYPHPIPLVVPDWPLSRSAGRGWGREGKPKEGGEATGHVQGPAWASVQPVLSLPAHKEPHSDPGGWYSLPEEFHRNS